MACETFVPKRFNAEHQRIIDHANELLEEMRDGGYAVTLRSLYYMFIAEEEWFPNTLQSYKRLGGIINDARLAGEIDWDLLEDRNREVEWITSWDSPQHGMEAIADQYQEDLWIGQERRVHVRIEKDSLVGVIGPVCKRLRLPYIACRGYTSQSEAYAAGKLLDRQIAEGLHPLIFYIGDHDPSGVDMTRDQTERLSTYSGNDIEVWRLALNMDQIDELRLPANPAKLTDSRSGALPGGGIRPGSYIDLYGRDSWEIDALRPTYIDRLITEARDRVIDHELWAERLAEEEHNQQLLNAVLNRWDEVEEMFGGGDE